MKLITHAIRKQIAIDELARMDAELAPYLKAISIALVEGLVKQPQL